MKEEREIEGCRNRGCNVRKTERQITAETKPVVRLLFYETTGRYREKPKKKKHSRELRHSLTMAQKPVQGVTLYG